MLTVEAGLKQVVVAADVVAGRVFRAGQVPDNPTWPYVTFDAMVSDVPSLRGDRGRALARRRESTWHLWQKQADVSFDLVDALIGALDGARPVVEGRTLWTARVISAGDVPDPSSLVVHHALDVVLHHAPGTT